MSNQAHHVLSKTVLRVDASEPFTDKLDEILRRRVSHVAIFAKGRCLGVSSFSDAILSSDDTTFGDLVEGQRCVNVSDAKSVEELCQAFADPSVEALVVENELGEFAGVVTRQSLLEALLKERKLTEESPRQFDMTEHKRAESLLAGEKRILEIISTSSSQDGGLTELAEFVKTQSSGVACSILLMDDSGTRLLSGASNNLPDTFVRAIDNMEIGPNAGACGTAAFLNQTVIVSDIATDPLCEDIRELALRHDLRACWSSPIHSSSGKVLGTIAIYFQHSQCPDDFHKALIDRAVYLAAIAIERKHAEDALRASETRNRTLLEGSPVCTKIIDLDSRLRYMSTAGQDQLKICDIEPFYGSTFPPELYPEAWRAPVAEHLERAKAGEISSLECPVLATDGKEVWYDTTFVPAFDENGHVQYIIVTSVNVTERRQAEEEARQHRDELAHVSRVSTMGELATGIAHELNQPLAAISSYSFAARSIVEQFSSGIPDLEETLGKLEEQAIRAGDIVRRLRDYVAKAESARVRADLNTLVRDVATLVEPDIRMAGTILKLILDDSAPTVMVDKIQIQQVLVNLIRNAIDAMRETPASQREITISTRVLQDGQAEVIVSDAGNGLAQDDLEQVFNAFFSTKQKGMGMGLPISRSIVEAHGGKLWAKSNAGAGATFGFAIPQENREEPDRNPIVFIVDDEAAMRDSLSMVVQAAGITVKCFSSAVEFLEVVEPNAISNPVCLIADVQMPNIDGIELLAKLNTLEKKLPVILITGHGTPALKQRAEELGAVALLEKPFRSAELHEIIAASLERTVE